MITQTAEPNDFVPLNKDPIEKRRINPSITSTKGSNINITEDSYVFSISPTKSPLKKTRKETIKIIVTDENGHFLKDINGILEKSNWGEVELIEYSNEIANKISESLLREEEKNNYQKVSFLADLLSKLYTNVQKILIKRNSEIATRYKLYSSFWELKSNLSKT